MAKELKLKVRKFWGPNPMFAEVTGEKLVGAGGFLPPPPSWIGLNNILEDLGLNLNLLMSKSNKTEIKKITIKKF